MPRHVTIALLWATAAALTGCARQSDVCAVPRKSAVLAAATLTAAQRSAAVKWANRELATLSPEVPAGTSPDSLGQLEQTAKSYQQQRASALRSDPLGSYVRAVNDRDAVSDCYRNVAFQARRLTIPLAEAAKFVVHECGDPDAEEDEVQQAADVVLEYRLCASGTPFRPPASTPLSPSD